MNLISKKERDKLIAVRKLFNRMGSIDMQYEATLAEACKLLRLARQWVADDAATSSDIKAFLTHVDQLAAKGG